MPRLIQELRDGYISSQAWLKGEGTDLAPSWAWAQILGLLHSLEVGRTDRGQPGAPRSPVNQALALEAPAGSLGEPGQLDLLAAGARPPGPESPGVTWA